MSLQAISSPELHSDWIRSQQAGEESSFNASSAQSHAGRKELTPQDRLSKSLFFDFSAPSQHKSMPRSPVRAKDASHSKSSDSEDDDRKPDARDLPAVNLEEARDPGSPRFSLSYSEEEEDPDVAHSPPQRAIEVLDGEGIGVSERVNEHYMVGLTEHHPMAVYHPGDIAYVDFQPAPMPPRLSAMLAEAHAMPEAALPHGVAAMPPLRYEFPEAAAANFPPAAMEAAERLVARRSQPAAHRGRGQRGRQGRGQRNARVPTEIVPTPQEFTAANTSRSRIALETWYQRLNELNVYRAAHGNCNVPQKYLDNPQLGIWVNKQRMEKKFMDDRQSTSMTMDRVRALESIGFTWAKRKGQHSWDAKCEELREYFHQHGHANVPTKFEANKALGRWVSTQRSQYKLYMQNKASHMTLERYNQLCEIGFTFDMLVKREDADDEE